MGSTITCPRLPSTWSATSPKSLPRPRRSPNKSIDAFSSLTSDPGVLDRWLLSKPKAPPNQRKRNQTMQKKKKQNADDLSDPGDGSTALVTSGSGKEGPDVLGAGAQP